MGAVQLQIKFEGLLENPAFEYCTYVQPEDIHTDVP